MQPCDKCFQLECALTAALSRHGVLLRMRNVDRQDGEAGLAAEVSERIVAVAAQIAELKAEKASHEFTAHSATSHR